MIIMYFHYLLLSLIVIHFNSCHGDKELFPPTGASWLDVGPVLFGNGKWEMNAVQEPQVFWDAQNDEFRMYYRGGWGIQSVGIATSKTGVTWKKYEKNPVFGGGGSNISDPVSGFQPYVLRERMDLYWLYTTMSPSKGHSNMSLASSKDGYLWTKQDITISLPKGCSSWGNRVVWIEDRNFSDTNNNIKSKKTYLMLQECAHGLWNIFLFTSADGFKWEVLNNGGPLSSLAIGSGGGMFGGPSFANVNGTLTPRNSSGLYNLWYHAAPAHKGVLPTDVYHAASKDLINWTISNNDNPVLKHSGKEWEYDQTADPSPVITPDGGAFLYYDGDDNRSGKAAIGVAIATSP